MNETFKIINENLVRTLPTWNGWENHAVPWFRDIWFWPLTAGAILYIPVIFGIKHYMKNREPFVLTLPLTIWNFVLAIFSAIGMIYTLPSLLEFIYNKGFEEAVCDTTPWRIRPEAVWICLFNLSKLFEMIDTVFIVLRKKPLIFLHWYHHIVTMLYCWYANQNQNKYNCAGWWFASINLTVHSFMYTYYGLTSLGHRPSWDFLLTSGQILQMVVGIAVVFQSARCKIIDRFDLAFAGIMYASYLVLFAHLFLNKYIYRSRRATTSKSQENGQSKPQYGHVKTE